MFLSAIRHCVEYSELNLEHRTLLSIFLSCKVLEGSFIEINILYQVLTLNIPKTQHCLESTHSQLSLVSHIIEICNFNSFIRDKMTFLHLP